MPEQSDKGSQGVGELGRLMTLRREDMRAEAGKAVTVRPGPEASPGDSLEKPFESTLRLFEDGEELPFAHVEHDEIRNLGGGRYSHWLNELYFSASDDSSPLTNGRTYTALLPGRRRSRQGPCGRRETAWRQTHSFSLPNHSLKQMHTFKFETGPN